MLLAVLPLALRGPAVHVRILRHFDVDLALYLCQLCMDQLSLGLDVRCVGGRVHVRGVRSGHLVSGLRLGCQSLGVGDLRFGGLLLRLGLVKRLHDVVVHLVRLSCLHLNVIVLHLALIILNVLLLNLINLLGNLLLRWLNLVEVRRRNLLSRRVLHLYLLGRARGHLTLALVLLLAGNHLLLLVARLVLALVLLLICGLNMLEKGIVHWLVGAGRADALIINLRLYLRQLSRLLIEIGSHARRLQQLHRLQRLLLVLRRADVLAGAEEVVREWLLYSHRNWLKHLRQRWR